jgi:hypothetical protein
MPDMGVLCAFGETPASLIDDALVALDGGGPYAEDTIPLYDGAWKCSRMGVRTFHRGD